MSRGTVTNGAIGKCEKSEQSHLRRSFFLANCVRTCQNPEVDRAGSTPVDAQQWLACSLEIIIEGAKFKGPIKEEVRCLRTSEQRT